MSHTVIAVNVVAVLVLIGILIKAWRTPPDYEDQDPADGY